jgi:hypothetical protein
MPLQEQTFTETHSKTTNSKGLINLNIGQGTPVSGTFSGINWAVNSKFIKVEIDPAGEPIIPAWEPISS